MLVVPVMPDWAVMKLSASGSSWAIATPHTLATDAGAVAFERGGNALDAAISAAVVLAVVYPHMCGVGGDLFALVQQPSGTVVAINASGRAPSAADSARASAAGAGRMPERGPLAVTVPGAVSGWAALHAQGAGLPWGEAFSQAIGLAYCGTAVSSSLAQALSGPDEPGADPALRAVFRPGGATPALGALVRQPALGATLQQLSTQGQAALYGGDLGERYVRGLRAAGVPIVAEDLRSHRADLGAPLRARYRDFDVLVHPPNSQGFVLLEALATIERLGIDPDPLGRDAGTLALVFSAAARDRDLHLADPDAMRVHASTLLDDGHLASLADEVRAGKVISSPSVRSSVGDTIALVTADAEGRGVSLIQSLFYGFGSGILEPSTGIVAQNRGACFTLDAIHPNVLAPMKRPAHTLMPVLVQREGRFEAASGSMGGYAQPQINAVDLIRALDLGMTPAEAVGAPRWLVGGMDPVDGTAPFAVAEASVPAETTAALGEAGFRVDTVGTQGGSVGHAHMIRSASEALDAGSDPRADGGARAG